MIYKESFSLASEGSRFSEMIRCCLRKRVREIQVMNYRDGLQAADDLIFLLAKWRL